jgi:hypothetical protein
MFSATMSVSPIKIDLGETQGLLNRNCSMKMLRVALLPSIAFLCLGSLALSQENPEPEAPSTSPQATKPSSKRIVSSSKSDKLKSKKKSKGDDSSTEETSGEKRSSTSGVEIFATRKMDMSFGMKFLAQDNYCTNLYGTIPFPKNWPEQRVTIVSSDIPTNAVCAYRDLPEKQPPLARQLLMKIPSLGPNDELNLVVHAEIEKSFINPPPDTTVFTIPKSVPADMNWFMKKSPYIDIENSEIRRLAKQFDSENPKDAWTHVELIYDWVRENIEYQNGKTQEIKTALKDRRGDCEEMTAIFVAICRASKIPARCVWIPEHCYPEFYLEDPQGEGHWFPCQVAGERQFGQMHEYRPILQKGDRFVVPELKSGPVRYVAHFFTCGAKAARAGLAPQVEQILDLGPLGPELAKLKEEYEAAIKKEAAEDSLKKDEERK